MSRKRRSGTTSSSLTRADQKSTADVKPTTTTDRQGRSERVGQQRTARKSTQGRQKRIRPWILPGFAGIAIIAIVLVGVSSLGTDDGSAAASQVPSPALGNRTAEVVIHEYADFQCPFCGVFTRTVKPELKEKYLDTGIARLVWHDFAWYGEESRRAANAARCAGDQGQFWEYHDLLFERQLGTNQGAFSDDNLRSFGTLLGLEPDAFETCMDENRYIAAVDADMSRVRRLGFNGTPSFVIGDQRIVGAQPFEVFERAIQAELQQQG